MRRKILSAIGATTLLMAISSGPAAADSPGTYPSCYGTNASYYATTYGGVENAVDAFDTTVQVGHDFTDEHTCDRTIGIIPNRGIIPPGPPADRAP